MWLSCLFKGDEGRSTFALSKLHWGAFRDANEKEDKYVPLSRFELIITSVKRF